MYFSFFNGFLYSIGWLICVFSGAKGHTLFPLFFTFLIVLSQLLFLNGKEKKGFIGDVFLLFYGVSLGFLMEIGFLVSGLLSYSTVNTLYLFFPPGWILSLYFLFTLTFNHSLIFLNKHFLLPPVFGFIGGIISYFAGYKIGAVFFPHLSVLVLLGLFWSAYLSLMIYLNKKLKELINFTYRKKEIKKEITVFFDGGCSICNKELMFLKKRKQIGPINYVSFSNAKELKTHTSKFSFDSAMKKIHAIDSQGNVLCGIDVFAKMYPKVALFFLSIFLQAPFFHALSRITYFFWAKYRLFKRCKI